MIKYKINSIEMKRYCESFKKFWWTFFIVVKKYKIISIEMKRYWKIFIVYLCTMDREREGPPSGVGGVLTRHI